MKEIETKLILKFENQNYTTNLINNEIDNLKIYNFVQELNNYFLDPYKKITVSRKNLLT
jgi:hypothetical protein